MFSVFLVVTVLYIINVMYFSFSVCTILAVNFKSKNKTLALPQKKVYLQTSERCLRELFTTEAHGKGISNAPFSVYFYCYPAQLRQRLKTQSRGAAVS